MHFSDTVTLFWSSTSTEGSSKRQQLSVKKLIPTQPAAQGNIVDYNVYHIPHYESAAVFENKNILIKVQGPAVSVEPDVLIQSP